MDPTPSPFERRVLSTVAHSPTPLSASQIARLVYGAERGYRYHGVVGLALKRLARQHVVRYDHGWSLCV